MPSNGQRGPALPARPAPAPAPAPAAAPAQATAVAQAQRSEEPEKVQKLREQLRQLRVGLLRFAGRLGMSNHSLTEHVKYRCGPLHVHVLVIMLLFWETETGSGSCLRAEDLSSCALIPGLASSLDMFCHMIA